MEGVTTVYQTIIKYLGYNPVIIVLFCLSLYIIIKTEKEKVHQQRYIWVFVLSIVIIFNDVTRKVLGRFTDMGTYYRFLWAVPFLFVFAKMIVDFVAKEKERKLKVLAFLLVIMCVVIGSSGKAVLSKDMTQGNIYNIPGDIMEISEIIQEDREEEQSVVAADFGILFDLRGYDASLIWASKRKPYQYAISGNWYPGEEYPVDMCIIRAVCAGIQEDTAYLKKCLKKRNVDYIITYNYLALDEYFAEVGYEVVGRTENRTVYGRAD